MKFLARSNQFNLESNLKKWNKSDGKCKLCTMNEIETLCHRLFICPHYVVQRTHFFTEIEDKCDPEISRSIFASDFQKKLELLLGDEVYLNWGHANGKILDKIVKQYLISIYGLANE